MLARAVSQLCHDGGDERFAAMEARQAHNLKVIGSNPIPATNRKSLVEKLFCKERQPRDNPGYVSNERK
jgi:hypothetical protein